MFGTTTCELRQLPVCAQGSMDLLLVDAANVVSDGGSTHVEIAISENLGTSDPVPVRKGLDLVVRHAVDNRTAAREDVMINGVSLEQVQGTTIIDGTTGRISRWNGFAKQSAVGFLGVVVVPLSNRNVLPE